MTDMHVHTSDSPDAEIPAWKLARMGMKRKITHIGFVAHMDLNPDDYCYNSLDPDGYSSSIGRAEVESGDRLEVLKGLEVGEPHLYESEVKELVDYCDFDFIVGALHTVEHSGMVLGPEPFREFEPLEVVEEYYTETLKIAESADIDVLAHMGLFRRGMALAGLDCSFDEASLWPGLISRILEVLIERNIALELNTSGLRRLEKMTYPVPGIISQYSRMGGRLVTVGSDTHREQHVFYGLEKGENLLRESGFLGCTVFRGREPLSVPLH